MILAHLSDTHITAPGQLLYGHIDTAAALRAAVTRVLRLQPAPDAVIITGDLVNAGRSDEYQVLREILGELPQPYILLPGNHDLRANLQAAFPAQPWLDTDNLCAVAPIADGVLVCLDSVVPGADGGVLTPASLQWLDNTLQQWRTTPTLVALHHPPFITGLAGMDQIACAGGELADCLARHPQVAGVLCGHVHRFCVGHIAGRPAIIAPSPAHQIHLELDGNPRDLAYTLEPGGFVLHRLTAGTLVSHYCPSLPAEVRRYY